MYLSYTLPSCEAHECSCRGGSVQVRVCECMCACVCVEKLRNRNHHGAESMNFSLYNPQTPCSSLPRLFCGSSYSWTCHNPKSLLPFLQLLITLRLCRDGEPFKPNLCVSSFSLSRLTIGLVSDERPFVGNEEIPTKSSCLSSLLTHQAHRSIESFILLLHSFSLRYSRCNSYHLLFWCHINRFFFFFQEALPL